MNQVKSILKVSEQGVSRPYLCTDEEDRIRWCKGCHTGFRSVISEWICACIARQLGLPIPDFAILKLDVDMFRQWRGYQANSVPEIVTDCNPYVFASLDAEGCKDVVNPQFDLQHSDKTLLAKIAPPITLPTIVIKGERLSVLSLWRQSVTPKTSSMAFCRIGDGHARRKSERA